MGRWAEELSKELSLLFGRLLKGAGEKPEEKKKKPLTIRDVGLPNLLVMLLAGMVLLVLTFPDFFAPKEKVSEVSDSSEKISGEDEVEAYIENAEEKLKTLLRKVEGVGDVEVMITVKSSGESIPLKDTPYEKSSNISAEEGTKRTETGERSEEGTVMVENPDGTTQPYVVRETVPEIEGVAVIAEGGGSSRVKKEIVEAVQVLFDIKAHKIKVMKMNHT